MDKRAFFYSILFMLISPAISLIHGVKGNFGLEFKRKLLIVFITIYGSIITISGTNDGVVHLNNVYDHYVGLSFINFFSEILDIVFFIDNPNINDDLYIHFVSYLTGGILGVPGLFFVVISFVYAYFFAGSLFKVVNIKNQNNYKFIVYFFILVFILWKNIEGINTVRTWTGLWVLFYASISYYQTKRKKYLLLMFFPPLIHIGYFIMAIPAWLVLIVGVKHKLFIIILIASFASTIVNQNSVITQLEKTEVGQAKVKGYYVEEKATTEQISEKFAMSTWYLKLYELGIQQLGISVIAFIIIGLGIYKLNMNHVESHLFSIGILTKALSNVSWFLFAIANRSAIVGGLFILASLVLFLIRTNNTRFNIERYRLFKILIGISSFMFIPFILYRLADMLYFISVYMLAFPFIPWFTESFSYSIREFIGIFI